MTTVKGYKIEPAAHLSEANLRGANLSAAHLSGANLSGADLSRAELIGAKLYIGNIRVVPYVESENDRT
jgi:uncharacterized protein YjbI with pentapeptide repeats